MTVLRQKSEKSLPSSNGGVIVNWQKQIMQRIKQNSKPKHVTGASEEKTPENKSQLALV